MDTLKIIGTAKTPTITFEPDGKLLLEGRSIPENSIEFYRPIVDWLVEYSQKPRPLTELHVKLEYYNTSSSKCILDLFKRLHEIQSKEGCEVVVKWYYDKEDEDMLESGSDYKEIIKIPFELISLEG